MKILLDTHIFLWYISADSRLPQTIKDAIQDSNNDVYLSVVSLWETIVKYQLGKAPLPQSPEIYLPVQRQNHQIASLDLDEASVSQLPKLPQLHRDPFGRMILCQALANGMSVATVDKEMRAYPVQFI
jgi:PIN domain nuclease of toxin-antitoxin system